MTARAFFEKELYMANKRKTIAVCVTGYDYNNETAIIEGMRERCNEADINLVIFYSSIRKPELNSVMQIPEAVVRGETTVYDLMNYDHIDAAAVFGASFLDDGVLPRLVGEARAHGIPILDIDDMDHRECRRLMLTSTYAMKKVVDHLIEVHGCKRLAFISGFKGNPQSEERLAAYRGSLEAHGIEYDESMVYYGEFWKKAYDCTTEIIGSGTLPDAIVCANDTMALFCMDCLKEHGYAIPDDIIVTGFDGLEEGGDYTPSPTTVKRALRGAGRAAVNALTEMMEGGGEPVPEQPEGAVTEDVSAPALNDICVEAILVKGESCGCVNRNDHSSSAYNKYVDKLNDYREFSRYILNMYTEFSGIQSSDRLFGALYRGTQLLGIKKMYVCISADIEHRAKGFDIESGEDFHICDRMVSMFMQGHDVPIGFEFPTSELVPDDSFTQEEPACFVVAPLYFKNRFLGYAAFDPPDRQLEGDILSTWLVTISNNAGSFYLNNELGEALGELESLYLHDHLTGCYNRRGLERYADDFMRAALAGGRYAAIACADVDRLKTVNDSFGHEEGDAAIVACANSLRFAFPKGSICARTGGDEFMVAAALDSPGECDEIRARIDEFCAKFNSGSGKPYTVGCSCGFSVCAPGEEYDFDVQKNTADKAMYEEKLRRKTMRR